MTKIKFIGVSIIVGGAALTGAMLGWELGLCRVEMTRDQLAMVGAGCGAILSIVGCATAIERSEARAQSRALMSRFERILFRTKQLADAEPMCAAVGGAAALRRVAVSCADQGNASCP